MQEINKENFNHYYKNILDMISTFKDSEVKSKLVMKNLEKFINNGTAIVAGHIYNKKLVTFIWCYSRFFSDNERLHISYFVVSEEYRKKGLSKELLEFVKSKAKDLNISQIDLNVDPENERAIKIYKKSGFKTEKLQLALKVDKGEHNV